MKNVIFSSKDCDQIADILNSTEPNRVRCVTYGKVASFDVAGSHDVLGVMIAGNKSVVIDTVYLSNHRKGTWTRVFHYLVDFCRRNRIETINIPVVLTAEMANWCEKNGFCSGDPAIGLGRQYKYVVR